jgi:carbamoyltransferase
MLRMARHVKRQTGERNLCLAGGVALNCVGNGKILREGIFDRLWIQPAAGDAGGALGAALFAWHQVLNQPRSVNSDKDAQRGSYLGPAFNTPEIEAWLNQNGLPYHRFDNGHVPELAAELIAQGKVVGWFSGRMEFGPRALGARSILGDARNPTMQSVMNLKIKNRESFRPFAPSCLREDVAEFFEMSCESPYMLLVAPVRPERRVKMNGQQEGLFGIDKLKVPRSDVPAITHVDYSARIQTVDRDDHPQYYRLIEAFKRRTGYGIIINTSFNVRGEPIVCTPPDAYLCFMRTQMDVLVLEDLVLYKQEQPPLKEDVDWRQLYELD